MITKFHYCFQAGWEMYSAEKSISLNSEIFNCFATLKIYEFNILAFSSALVIMLSSCTNIILSEDFTSSNKRGFTIFENLYQRCLSHLFHLNVRNNLFSSAP